LQKSRYQDKYQYLNERNRASYAEIELLGIPSDLTGPKLQEKSVYIMSEDDVLKSIGEILEDYTGM